MKNKMLFVLNVALFAGMRCLAMETNEKEAKFGKFKKQDGSVVYFTKDGKEVSLGIYRAKYHSTGYSSTDNIMPLLIAPKDGEEVIDREKLDVKLKIKSCYGLPEDEKSLFVFTSDGRLGIHREFEKPKQSALNGASEEGKSHYYERKESVSIAPKGLTSKKITFKAKKVDIPLLFVKCLYGNTRNIVVVAMHTKESTGRMVSSKASFKDILSEFVIIPGIERLRDVEKCDVESSKGIHIAVSSQKNKNKKTIYTIKKVKDSKNIRLVKESKKLSIPTNRLNRSNNR